MLTTTLPRSCGYLRPRPTLDARGFSCAVSGCGLCSLLTRAKFYLAASPLVASTRLGLRPISPEVSEKKPLVPRVPQTILPDATVLLDKFCKVRRNVTKSKIGVLFLQLATHFFVGRQVLKQGVASWTISSATRLSTVLRCKLPKKFLV